MDLTDPVAVGEVHADGRAWRSVTCLAGHVHHVVRDAHHLGLLVRIHERHVVLEPLGVVHHDGHALGCLEVLDLYHGLIAARVAQRIVVHFNEAIDVVDVAFGVLDPVDVVEAPLLEVSGAVVIHQMTECGGLLVVLSI